MRLRKTQSAHDRMSDKVSCTPIPRMAQTGQTPPIAAMAPIEQFLRTVATKRTGLYLTTTAISLHAATATQAVRTTARAAPAATTCQVDGVTPAARTVIVALHIHIATVVMQVISLPTLMGLVSKRQMQLLLSFPL